MKKIIIPSIIIIVVAIGYYFVSFLPSQTDQEKQVFLFTKQTECTNICERLYLDDKNSLPNSIVLNPEYAYNENENTCFYSGGWVSINPNALTKRVLNCQTNEEVLTFMTIDNEVFTNFCDTCVNSSIEYDLKEVEFMGN
jgi:hypothetical protein